MGKLCPVLAAKWNLIETLPKVSFRAPRSPEPSSLENLALALKKDISYQIPTNFFKGAGDTYFSGKALGKLARILLIAEEVQEICNSTSSSSFGGRKSKDARFRSNTAASGEYTSACDQAMPHIPTQLQFDMALDHLQQAVQIWLSDESQAPFVYDKSWGGVVSCGCQYSYGNCLNKLPNCPGFTDKLLNFGNGMYNDHHFHYGYHIYAFATVAKFRPEWGRQYFEKILLLVRDIANPSPQDPYFAVFRHKDWYQGHSWANGIGVTFLNGMNQESSSEAIASYEAVTLFGKTMQHILSGEEQKVARDIYKAGLLLTSTEIRSARRYYQVTHSASEEEDIYPAIYEPKVVGIVWSMMVHYGTWL